MNASEAYQEWITIGHNRIVLESPYNYPDTDERFIAEVAVKTIEHNASESARVVSVFYNDKTGNYSVTIASTNQVDIKIESILTRVLQGIFGKGNVLAKFQFIKPEDDSPDRYNLHEH